MQLTLYSDPSTIPVSLNQIGFIDNASCKLLDLNESEYVSTFTITYTPEEVTKLSFITNKDNKLESGQISGNKDEKD